MIVLLFILCYISAIVSFQHSKSYFIENNSHSILSFASDDDYLYIPVTNANVQRSFGSTEVVRTMLGHSSPIIDLFLYNGTLVSGSIDGLVLQWNLRSGAMVNRLETKCGITKMELYFDSFIVSCGYSVAQIVKLETFKLQESSCFDSITNLYFYAYRNMIFSYFNGPGIIMYQRNCTKSLAYVELQASALVGSGDLLFIADKATFHIRRISPATGDVVNFEGTGHKATVRDMCICGDYLVSGSEDFSLILWNITSKTQVRSISTIRVNKIIGLSSTLFLYGGTSGAVYLFDLNSFAIQKTFVGQQKYLSSLVIYNDFVFAGSTAVEVKQWSIITREQQNVIKNSFSHSLYMDNNNLLWCGQSVVAYDLLKDVVVKEFAINQVACDYVFYYFKGYVYTLSYTSHNVVNKYNLTDTALILQFLDYRITGGGFGILAQDLYLFVIYFPNLYVQWDAKTGILQQIYTSVGTVSFTSYRNNVLLTNNNAIYMIDPFLLQTTVYFNPGFSGHYLLYDEASGILFVVSDLDCTIYGFDTRNSFSTVYTFKGHTNFVYSMIVKDGSLFSSSEDGTVKQWSLVTKRIVYSYEDRTQSVVSLACYEDSLVFGTLGGDIYEFAINSAFLKYSNLSQTTIADIVFCDGLLFVGLEYYISIFSSESFLLVPKYQVDTKSSPRSLFVSNGFLYSGQVDFGIMQWNYTSGLKLKLFLGHDAVINDLLILKNKMFSAGSDSLIGRWNIDTLDIELKFKGHTDQVSSILELNGMLISSSFDKTIIIWDMATSLIKNTLKRTSYVLGHLGPINQIKLCGGDLFSASSDLTIKRWNIRTGAVIDTMFGHTKSVNCLSCHNNAIFSGSDDFAVLLWYPPIQKVSSESKSFTTSVQTFSLTVASLQSSLNMGITSSLYIIIGVVLFCFLILLGLVVCYRQKRIYSDKKTSYIDNTRSSNQTTDVNNAETLFTQALGIAIPGYLEYNLTTFRLLKQIAKGGGGAIYLAETFGKQDKVIAKVIHDNYYQMSDLLKTAFDQEITLMAFLKPNKNIAKIIGFCRQPCVILMKFYEKGSFKNLIYSERRWSLGKATKCLLDISNGIRYMHTRNVVHGDLKPDNILVDTDENGVVMVLTDFGISHILGTKELASAQFKIAKLRGLSVQYAAPELFERFREKVQEIEPDRAKAGDMYAFGSIIYETVVKNIPWSRN